jgi:hypothetical protein
VAAGLAIFDYFWVGIRTWLGPRFTVTAGKAATDFRWWIIVLIIGFIYTAAPEVYRRATAPVPKSEGNPQVEGGLRSQIATLQSQLEGARSAERQAREELAKARQQISTSPAAAPIPEPANAPAVVPVRPFNGDYFTEMNVISSDNSSQIIISGVPTITANNLRVCVDYSINWKNDWLPTRRAAIAKIESITKGKLIELPLLYKSQDGSLLWGGADSVSPIVASRLLDAQKYGGIDVRAELLFIGETDKQRYYLKFSVRKGRYVKNIQLPEDNYIGVDVYGYSSVDWKYDIKEPRLWGNPELCP